MMIVVPGQLKLSGLPIGKAPDALFCLYSFEMAVIPRPVVCCGKVFYLENIPGVRSIIVVRWHRRPCPASSLGFFRSPM